VDFGNGVILEPDTMLPAVCDGCEYAQRRWDAWQAYLDCPGCDFPDTDGPPKRPPVRR
jgi:hypothetical protein